MTCAQLIHHSECDDQLYLIHTVVSSDTMKRFFERNPTWRRLCRQKKSKRTAAIVALSLVLAFASDLLDAFGFLTHSRGFVSPFLGVFLYISSFSVPILTQVLAILVEICCLSLDYITTTYFCHLGWLAAILADFYATAFIYFLSTLIRLWMKSWHFQSIFGRLSAFRYVKFWNDEGAFLELL